MAKTATAASVDSSTQDTGKLILRVTLGVLILLHGIAKISGGIDGIGGMLAKMGLPAALSYLVYVGEVLAPALVILGVFTRPAALVIVVNMIVAVALAHSQQLFSLGKTGGHALELQFMFLFAAVAVALLGAGRFSLGGLRGRWN